MIPPAERDRALLDNHEAHQGETECIRRATNLIGGR